MPHSIIDIGVNLGHRSFDADRDKVIDRAVESGVHTMILTGTTERGSKQAYDIAVKRPAVLYSTAGVHPHNAKQCNDHTMSNLKKLAEKKEVLAIGECGLDFNRDFSPRKVQEQYFEKQIELACELQMPLFLHERDAHDRFATILNHYIGDFPGAVVHCFTGTEAEADIYLALGLHLGITGWICDERRGTHLRNVVKKIPMDRLMIETDAPFLTPRDLRPKPDNNRNEPCFLPHILNTIAQCMNLSVDELAKQTTNNARRFFKIPE